MWLRKIKLKEQRKTAKAKVSSLKVKVGLWQRSRNPKVTPLDGPRMTWHWELRCTACCSSHTLTRWEGQAVCCQYVVNRSWISFQCSMPSIFYQSLVINEANIQVMDNFLKNLVHKFGTSMFLLIQCKNISIRPIFTSITRVNGSELWRPLTRLWLTCPAPSTDCEFF